MYPKIEPRSTRWKIRDHPYVDWLKMQPCYACGDPGPSEFAHVLGAISMKSGLPLPRRVEVAKLVAIPLCSEDHRTGKQSVHQIGEEAFAELHADPHTLAHVALTYMARYLVETAR